MKKFYDTNSLLSELKDAFKEPFYISNITLKEIENIKTSMNKDPDIKYKARKLINLLDEHENDYTVINYQNKWDKNLLKNPLFLDNNDSRIIFTATKVKEKEDIVFITKDICCKQLAKTAGLQVNYLKDEIKDNYTGYKEVIIDDKYNNYYEDIFSNNNSRLNLNINEYLLIKDQTNNIIDKYKYTSNNEFQRIPFNCFESKMFGKIKPKDAYQAIAMDSLVTNQITVFRGGAGTGKSLLSLAYLFQELEKNNIDKIVMFVNPVATKDSCKFGFLPGDLESKILGSQIGNFLSSKLGNIEAVYQLIDNKQLEFIALADCRGYDTSGSSCAVYCTESQNMSIEQMKLILSRIGENTKVIIEGDNLWQTDLLAYEGSNNGLKRICEVFKGMSFCGITTLQNCYRSKIANQIAKL